MAVRDEERLKSQVAVIEEKRFKTVGAKKFIMQLEDSRFQRGKCFGCPTGLFY